MQALCDEGELDYIDLSLWDSFKEPNEPEFQSKPLMHWFNELDRGAILVAHHWTAMHYIRLH